CVGGARRLGPGCVLPGLPSWPFAEEGPDLPGSTHGRHRSPDLSRYMDFAGVSIRGKYRKGTVLELDVIEAPVDLIVERLVACREALLRSKLRGPPCLMAISASRGIWR